MKNFSFKKVLAVLAVAAVAPISASADINTPVGSVHVHSPVGGFNIHTPVGNAGIHTPFGGFGMHLPGGINAHFSTSVGGFGIPGRTPFTPIGINPPPGGFNIHTPVGNAGIHTPFGGFGLAPVDFGFPGFGLGGYMTGLELNGNGTQNPTQMSAVQCSFGEELLLASSVDSCESANGTVDPAQMSYEVQCSIEDAVVMSPSQAVCERLGGQTAG